MLLRRRVLEGGIVVAAGSGLSRLVPAATLPATPAQTAGPFYPLTLPVESDNDLIHVAGRKGRQRERSPRSADAFSIAMGTGFPAHGLRIWQCDVLPGGYHYVPGRPERATGRREISRDTGRH